MCRIINFTAFEINLQSGVDAEERQKNSHKYLGHYATLGRFQVVEAAGVAGWLGPSK